MPKFVHDQRTGGGYGYLGRKGFQSDPQKGPAAFPYQTDDTVRDEDLSDEDLNLRAKINRRLSYGNLGRSPEPYSRTDRFTLAKNRLNLAESETPGTTLIGMVPFPMRRFDGPAIGGHSVNPSYRVAPGVVDVSPAGWTRGDVKLADEGPAAPPRFIDAVDPEIRERARKKLKIARLK
jgi:hypothetical protein